MERHKGKNSYVRIWVMGYVCLNHEARKKVVKGKEKVWEWFREDGWGLKRW